jgi:DNA polymerase-3 subunit delta'
MSILPWQHKNWDLLSEYRRQDRVPQALLIVGNAGLGKLHLANQFAFSLLCHQPKNNDLYCGHCHACLLLKAETHPDFIQLSPEEPGKAIVIDQVRHLLTRLTLKPQLDSYRAVIVSPAELMNKSAANAFLKCLEEPPERTVIILITEKMTQLPATILSRCQKLAVYAPSKKTFFTWLTEQNTNEIPNNNDALYNLTQGSPLLALDYASNNTMVLRNECFNSWLNIAKLNQHPIIVAEHWHKQSTALLLFWITTWTIDIIKCYYQIKPDWLYNPDLKEPLQAIALDIKINKLYQFYDLILISRQQLNTQINKHNMFEEILINWLELNADRD